MLVQRAMRKMLAGLVHALSQQDMLCNAKDYIRFLKYEMPQYSASVAVFRFSNLCPEGRPRVRPEENAVMWSRAVIVQRSLQSTETVCAIRRSRQADAGVNVDEGGVIRHGKRTRCIFAVVSREDLSPFSGDDRGHVVDLLNLLNRSRHLPL
jgi:hypothetical protein